MIVWVTCVLLLSTYVVGQIISAVLLSNYVIGQVVGIQLTAVFPNILCSYYS